MASHIRSRRRSSLVPNADGDPPILSADYWIELSNSLDLNDGKVKPSGDVQRVLFKLVQDKMPVNMITTSLQAGYDINTPIEDVENGTLLHAAVKFNHFAALRFLHARGGDLSARCEDEGTLIHWFGEFGDDPDVLDWLLQRGVPLEAIDGDGETALHWARSVRWEDQTGVMHLAQPACFEPDYNQHLLQCSRLSERVFCSSMVQTHSLATLMEIKQFCMQFG